jgi:vacuolar-type H+-ATPase subunit H
MASRTPAEWLDLLEHRLHERWGRWKVYDEYYEGDHRLSAWLSSVQQAFRGTVLGNLLLGLTDNYMPLVVDSAAERLRVQGIRFGKSEDADDDAWAIWQANGLDAQANMVHTESIKLGEAYWMVQPNGEDVPTITAEHPSQVIVATAPGNRRTRLAALKKWREDDGYTYANVYLPDRVWKFRSKQNQQLLEDGRGNWDGIGSEANPLGVVPVVPMPNNPSMLYGGRSDLAGGATSLQDLIEKTVIDLMIGAEYHGLPQRVMLGVEPPRDPVTGKVIADAEMQKQRLWYFNSPEAKAHEFSQADLKGLRESADGFIGDLAAQTRIPIYYFRPAAISNISAEALIGLDAGLVSKTDDKKDPFGEGHEEMTRLSFLAMDRNDPRAQETSAETVWADTESRSQAQVADAASKKKDIGVTWEQSMEDLGYSPQQIERMAAQREADALLNETQPNASQPAQPATDQQLPAAA